MANTIINTPELLNLDSATGATVLAKGTISQRPPVQTFSVEYLAVAGGGGGGYQDAGGGGAGGFLTNTLSSINNGQSFTLTIGEGGAGGTKSPAVVNSGDNTVIAYGSTTITAIGGGGGSSDNNVVVAASGGSGGGGAGGSGTSTGGAGTTGQGNAGGNGASNNRGGGGGGAGAAGQNATSSGANGGIGLTTTIISTTNATTASVGEVSGSNLYFAGGGGGDNRTVFGSGGLGGGTNAAANPIDAAANTGGGGGSAYNGSPVRGGAGGSGVIILKYSSSVTLTKGSGLTEASGSPFTEGSYRVSVFTQGTGNVTLSTTPGTLDAINGTLRFNTDTNKTEYFDGANWYEIVDEYASGFTGPATNYFDTKLYTGNNATQSIGGYINGSASFNGSNSKIDLPNNILPNNSTASSSCSFWFKSSSGNSTGDSETIIDAWSYSTSEPGWGLFMEPAYGGFPDGQLYLANYYLGGTSGGTGNVTFRDGNWHFGVVVLDFSGGTIKVYIDGNSTPVLSQTVSSSNVDVFTTNAAIGYQNANPSYPRHFNGAIDQVRIYSDALTTSEIAYLYANENSTTAEQLNPSGFPTNCVAAYTMDTSANGPLNTQDLSTVDYPAGTGCIALYEMNGNSNDTSGTYNGTPINITYQGGAFDQAAVFNGSNSYIDTNIISSIFNTNTWSISFWFYQNNSNTYGYVLGNTNSSILNGFALGYYSDGSRFDFITRNGSGTVGRWQGGTPTSNTWIYLTIVNNNNSFTFYQGGSQANNYSTYTQPASGGSYNSSSDFVLGRAGFYNTEYHNGKIDQVRIFDTALSASDITTLARGVATSYGGTTTNVNFNGHLDFAPDLVWIKVRSAAGYNHNLFDKIRGATYRLMSNNVNAQDSNGHLTAFNNNGFTLDAGGDANPSQEMISWNWKAGGTAVANNNGNIASQVSANKDSGFSIVKYTGNLSSATTATGQSVGHGLAEPPNLIIFKGISNASDWWVMSSELTNWSTRLRLNDTSSTYDYYSQYPMANPTSDVFYTNYLTAINVNARTYIAYCWHSVTGFSSIGSYVGTGVSGLQVTSLGFAPSFVMIKNISDTGSWIIHSKPPTTTNPSVYHLRANSDAGQDSGANEQIDFDDDGFTLTGTGQNINHSHGDTYLYIAFA